MKYRAASASRTRDHTVSAVRMALRSAPVKPSVPSPDSLKAAVAELLPDLLAFRRKGYTDGELALFLHDNGLQIAVSTLRKYIGATRPRSRKPRRAKPASPAHKASVAKPSPVATKPDPPPKPSLRLPRGPQPQRRLAKDVLGHRFDDDV